MRQSAVLICCLQLAEKDEQVAMLKSVIRDTELSTLEQRLAQVLVWQLQAQTCRAVCFSLPEHSRAVYTALQHYHASPAAPAVGVLQAAL